MRVEKNPQHLGADIKVFVYAKTKLDEKEKIFLLFGRTDPIFSILLGFN